MAPDLHLCPRPQVSEVATMMSGESSSCTAIARSGPGWSERSNDFKQWLTALTAVTRARAHASPLARALDRRLASAVLGVAKTTRTLATPLPRAAVGTTAAGGPRLGVGDKEHEVVVFDQVDVGDRCGVMVAPTSGREGGDVANGGQGDTGVVDGVLNN